jgi:hypothetical protein
VPHPNAHTPTIAIAIELGSGTATKKPLISPSGYAVEWMSKYIVPAFKLAKNAAAAPSAEPPLACKKSGE